MGTASCVGRCGCVKTRLLEPDDNVWITWDICPEHYRGEPDDVMVVEAARNRRACEWTPRRSGEMSE